MTLAPAATAIGIDAGDKAAVEAKDPRMKPSVYALHEDAAMVPCRGRRGIPKSPRCLDPNYILTTVNRR
ncbi:MAG TPA: hypothetical protein VK804_01590, partial [Bradyrhizobium sp.]|uniref:hypothetical protein n=1 Tax=Bradyrhizobium sp. TaxID=376 RepID=UPI002CCDBDF1